MKIILMNINVLVVLKLAQGTINGLTYMDQMISGKDIAVPKGEDPCNPLYWYPRSIPDHCQFKKVVNPTKPDSVPIPMPIPVPILPQPMLPGIPPAPPPPIIAPPLSPPIFTPPIYPPPMPFNPAHPIMPPFYGSYPPILPPIPNLNIPGIFPYPSIPTGYPHQAGMVPGIPGIVTSDGGINILPFSDVYSDLLQKHKHKMIQKKLQRVLEDYEDYPRSKHFRIRKRLRNIYF